MPVFFGQRFAAPGRLVEVPGGVKLHLNSQGLPTAATVVFEAGISGSSLGWATVQPLVSQFAQTVSYDRAGLGWSTGSLTPRTVSNMTTELASALEAARIRAPYVLVGHSFGGLLVQAFAHTNPDKTAAVIMLDPVTHTGWANPDSNQIRRLQAGARLARRGALLARFGIVRATLTVLMNGGARFAQLVSRASSGPGNSTVSRLTSEVGKLPPETHPLIASHWSRASSFNALAAYLECLPASARLALDMPIPPEIPLLILSAANATSDELAERNSWVAARPNSRHEQIPGTSHWLQLDRPDLVVSAIRDVLSRVR